MFSDRFIIKYFKFFQISVINNIHNKLPFSLQYRVSMYFTFIDKIITYYMHIKWDNCRRTFVEYAGV